MIYFDNSSTTKPYKEVVELVARLMSEEFEILHLFIFWNKSRKNFREYPKSR